MSAQEPNKAMLWGGRIVSAAVVLMMVGSASGKIMAKPEMVTMFTSGGYPAGALRPLGIVEALCAILYAIPQTSVLGAVLLTGYLGGAIDVHVRGGMSVLLPLALGIATWLGLFLREPRIRELLPIRRG